jgi:hypothetical protein
MKLENCSGVSWELKSIMNMLVAIYTLDIIVAYPAPFTPYAENPRFPYINTQFRKILRHSADIVTSIPPFV